MSTDPTPLQERIERALREHAFVEHSPGAGEHVDLSPQAAKYLAARIAPIIAAEVRKAQAGAWDEGFEVGESNGYAIGRDIDTDENTENPYRNEED